MFALATVIAIALIDKLMSTGQSVANDCQDPEANHPYQPYDWPDASATLTLKERDGQSSVAIDINNARPNTHYTVWLRLRGEDSNGNTFGGSPLTGIPGTPLIPSSELGTALSQLPGTENELNGFYTDDEGTARYEIALSGPHPLKIRSKSGYELTYSNVSFRTIMGQQQLILLDQERLTNE